MYLLLSCAVGLATCVGGPISALVAQQRTQAFQSDVSSKVKPWTHLDFYNNPRNFKFGIISDRAGGVRPGVFKDGVEKLNLLMPEFVMSVGDFIPGNTQDRAQLESEWAEFDAELKPLKVPFFFIPGNHDINNDVMREIWMKRSGVPFYSFVYKDVLFLALDTTGEKGEIVPDYQVESMRQALAEHADVRWTFVFMHHPLWLYTNPGGFTRIEELLKGRQHTVFAGHTHNYLHEWRNNAHYYILATTGGGSRLRGQRFGEFDHVTLVTVTDDGPIMANLLLEGILPHDATTRADYELSLALLRASRLPYTLLTDDEEAVASGTLYLTLENPSQRELQVDARFMHDHQFTMQPQNIKMTLAPNSQQIVEVSLHSSDAVPTVNPALLQLDWKIGYAAPEQKDLFVSGTRQIPLSPTRKQLIATVAPQYVESLSVSLTEPENDHDLYYTTDGSTPTTASTAYEMPFDVTGEMTVKARMFNEHGHGTATDTQSYRPVPAGTGLRYRFYEGTWTRMPDFKELEPIFEGVATDLALETRQLWADNWGMVLEGDLQIDVGGEYTFYLNSDDGSLLYIDDELVVNNDGDHSELELSGTSHLSAGSHKLRIDFFEAGGEAILELDLAGPDGERRPLPFEKVSH